MEEFLIAAYQGNWPVRRILAALLELMKHLVRSGYAALGRLSWGRTTRAVFVEPTKGRLITAKTLEK